MIIKKIKYKSHIICKVYEDLGEDKREDNYIYHIYKDGKYINAALTLSNAKEYILNGYNDTYLC